MSDQRTYRGLSPEERAYLKSLYGSQGLFEYTLDQYIAQGKITKDEAANWWDVGMGGKREYAYAEWEAAEMAKEAAKIASGELIYTVPPPGDKTPKAAAQRAIARAQQEWLENVPQMKGYQEVAGPYLEGMTVPAMKQYYQRELGQMYGEAGMPTARQKWYEEKYKVPKYRVFGPGGQPVSAEGQFTPQHLAFTDYDPELAKRMTAEVDPFGNLVQPETRLSRSRTTQDPWDKLLSEIPFLEKWHGLPPEERGYFSGRFRPRARFL